GPAMAQAMLSRGWKTVSILAQQNPFVIPMIEPAKKTFAAAGTKVLDTVIYNPDQPSYRAERQRLFGTNPTPERLMCLGRLTGFVSMGREAIRWGATRKSVALSIRAAAEEKFIGGVGPDVGEGIELFQPAPPLGSPSYKKFQKLMGATDENALY